MTEHPDILIIGGGVIGLTTAYFLAAEGVAVTLVDQGDLGQQASWAGAGIIPAGDQALAHTSYEKLRARSVALFPALSQELRGATGIDNGYVVCGGLELPEPGAPAPLPTEEWSGEGIVFQELARTDLERLVPGLPAELDRGAYFPGMAQVRNPRHVRALRAGCEARGVRSLPQHPVRRLVRQGERIAGAETQHGLLTAGRYLIAAGAWADELLAQVGWRPGVRPVRGQIALLNTGHEGVRPILLQGKRYLVPRPDGKVLVGSTEEDAGFDARPTASGIEGLLHFASELLPSLRVVALERCWAGLRPGTPDGLPFLGMVPGCPNLFVAAGHFRAGIQLAPATGQVMTELLLGQPTSVPLDDFRLAR